MQRRELMLPNYISVK